MVRLLLRAPSGPVDLDRYPFRVARDSTRSSAMSGPVSGNSRLADDQGIGERGDDPGGPVTSSEPR